MQPNLAAIIEAFALEMEELGIDFAMITRDPKLQEHGLRLCLATNQPQEYGEAMLATYLEGIHGGAVVKDFRQVDLETGMEFRRGDVTVQ